jgi:carbon-monoxide dehydrogenase medium subunit
MYPRPFEYQRAGSVQEAVALLQANPDAKIIAGGHSLLPAMKLRLASPGALVDIFDISELKSMSFDNGATIGAGVTWANLLANDNLKQYGALHEAVARVGDVQVRNRGTIGGSAAHADPAADIPAALLVLNAEFVAQGPDGERTISAADFFVDILTTALEPEEVLTAIKLPAPDGKSAYEKFAHPASGYAVCGVAAAVANGGGVRLAVTGATYTVTRLSAVEAALGGELTAESIAAACANAGEGLDLAGDHFASAEYRAHLVGVMAKRALMRAAGLS